MDTISRTIETVGTIDEHRRLHVDGELPIAGPSRVRVIIHVPAEPDDGEREWLRVAATNPAFDFLAAPEEDVYTLADGKPFSAEG